MKELVIKSAQHDKPLSYSLNLSVLSPEDLLPAEKDNAVVLCHRPKNGLTHARCLTRRRICQISSNVLYCFVNPRNSVTSIQCAGGSHEIFRFMLCVQMNTVPYCWGSRTTDHVPHRQIHATKV
ncbi:hypothetical protein TGRH88_077380 [Toxoplasma gondii]|uniref:Uncharacterized protein n=1 Tax=Toxoplasma gondii TaxID=5811 RepID=A0A7J6K5X5_TOXGO|nr:hypothetical protein TGRH88_077380 [Toxoplasma gondii]